MNSRLRAYFQKVKAHRLGSTLTVVATLALGILIGTVATHSGKGKALAGFNSSDDAVPLQVPAPKQLSSAFAQISKQIEPSVVNINTDSTIKTPSRKGRRAPGAVEAAMTNPCRISLTASSADKVAGRMLRAATRVLTVSTSAVWVRA